MSNIGRRFLFNYRFLLSAALILFVAVPAFGKSEGLASRGGATVVEIVEGDTHFASTTGNRSDLPAYKPQKCRSGDQISRYGRSVMNRKMLLPTWHWGNGYTLDWVAVNRIGTAGGWPIYTLKTLPVSRERFCVSITLRL